MPSNNFWAVNKAKIAATQTPEAKARAEAAAAGYIDEGRAEGDPRSVQAELIKKQSDDFFRDAVPLKNDLLAMTTYNGGTGVLPQLQAAGLKSVNQEADKAEAQIVRNQERFGVSLTPEQQAAQTSTLQKGRALGQVDSMNRAALFQKDLNKELVAGTAANTVQASK
jgi:hypothetical protein